jgi:hypothetical protein
MTKLQTKLAIAKVGKIRARNNLLWMELLTLSVESRPRKAKEIIKKITENDKEVTSWLSRI